MTLARAYCRPVITRLCPACDSRRVTLVDVVPGSGRFHSLGTVFIGGWRQCGLLFVNPMPTAESLHEVYSRDGRWARGREVKAEVIDPSSRSLTYLGHLLERAFPRHEELGALPDSPTYDLLILHHVIEHVGAPLTLLRDACRALKQGGVALVSVPQLDTLPEHRDFKYCISPSSHIVCYSRDCLCILMEMAGFEPVDAQPHGARRRTTRRDLKRLRMIGVKRAHSPIEVRRPLGAARRALAKFHDASGDGWSFRVVSPRVRGMALHLRRRATRSRPEVT